MEFNANVFGALPLKELEKSLDGLKSQKNVWETVKQQETNEENKKIAEKVFGIEQSMF